jgi:alpha-ketoglutarate-dependent taurine dioxygenase
MLMSQSAEANAFTVEWLSYGGTRLLVATASDLSDVQAQRCAWLALIDRHLHECGAILFRGHPAEGASVLQRAVRLLGSPPINYEFGSSPRHAMAEGVYSSTDYPAHQWIPQHNEQAYTTRWPRKIIFYCDVAPGVGQGGQTPLADSRVVYQRIDPVIRRRFAERGLLYVRNYGTGLDLPWEQAFGTNDPSAVEAFCDAQNISWEWFEGGQLRTRQLCQSEVRHPVTMEPIWFNQAHLFHISAHEASTRQALLSIVEDPLDLPRSVYYGDGSQIEDWVLESIRDAYRSSMLSFLWQGGDLLLLDNMLMTHGRAPFRGPRRVLVAMTEPWSANNSSIN